MKEKDCKKQKEMRTKEGLKEILGYISKNYEEIQDELTGICGLDKTILTFEKLASAYRENYSFFIDSIENSDQNARKEYKSLKMLFSNIKTKLGTKYAENLFAGINILNLNEEIKKTVSTMDKAKGFIKGCNHIVLGISFNLERLNSLKTQTEKLSVLKGMLLIY